MIYKQSSNPTFTDLKKMMKKEGISCKKYNQTLDNYSSFQNYDSIIKLNWDETDILIYNYYPNYDHIKSSLEMLPKIDRNSGKFEKDDVRQMKEEILKLSTIGYREKKTKASFKLKDLKGFIFGAFNSRFWKMRKHINNLESKELWNLPFYSWECITLETKDHDINFVVRDQNQMNLLLKFLICELNTVDGVKDSAISY